MNKQLRQFERDSGLDIFGLGAKRVKWEAALEKYAQLIVNESITVMKQHDYHGEWLGEKIKEHFGVEE